MCNGTYESCKQLTVLSTPLTKSQKTLSRSSDLCKISTKIVHSFARVVARAASVCAYTLLDVVSRERMYNSKQL